MRICSTPWRLDVHFELPADLQRVLDDDLVLLQQQKESVNLDRLHNDLKSLCEQIDKQQPAHRALTIPFFAGPNAASGKNESGLAERNLSIASLSLSRFRDRQTSTRFNATHSQNVRTQDTLRGSRPTAARGECSTTTAKHSRYSPLDRGQRDQKLLAHGEHHHLGAATQ